MARNRWVQNAHSVAFLPRLRAPALARLVRGRTVRRHLVALLGLQLGIELVDALGIPRQRLDRHRAVDEHRQHGDPLLVFQPLDPVEQLLDAADRKRRE